jgi:hypothetical protein
MERLDRSTGSPYRVYLSAGGALVLLAHAVYWMTGAMPPAAFSGKLALTAAWSSLCFAAHHYLRRAAGDSLADYRPVLRVSDPDFRALRQAFVRTPFGTTLLCILAAPILLWLVLLGDRSFYGLLTGVALADASVYVLGLWNSAWILMNLAQMGHYILGIDRLHARARRVDLFDRRPALAFSALSYRTSLVASVLIYLFVAVFREVLENPTSLTIVVGGVILTLGAFVLPLRGMNRLLAQEKAMHLAEVRSRIQAGLADLHRRVDRGSAARLQAANLGLTSLIQEEAYLEGIPTWPWPRGMFARLGTLTLLPIGLYLTQRLLEQVVVR